MSLLTAEKMREVRQLHGRLIQAHPAWDTADQLAIVGALAMVLSHNDAQAELLRRAYPLLEDWAGVERQLRQEIAAIITTSDAAKEDTPTPERQTLAVPFEVARDAVELVRAQAEALEWLVKHIHAGRAFYRDGGWRDFEHYSDARLEATQKKAAVWRALAVALGEEKGEGHR